MNQSDLKVVMGIVNITPNSFSDGGDHFSLDAFDRQIKLLSNNVKIIDIGAESTAPFNEPITFEEEISRFERILFPYIRSGKWDRAITLSIDTYRPETFEQIYHFVKSHDAQIDLIWNDVSGVLDEKLFQVLHESCPDAQYVFSHSRVADRQSSSDHMSYLSQESGDNFVKEVVNYFSAAYKEFAENKVIERIIFDPCFGFSKSREQNQSLLKNLKILIESLPDEMHWMLGVSRKSFLRYLPKEDERLIYQTELLHAMLIGSWINNFPNKSLIMRVHDPLVCKMIGIFANDFASSNSVVRKCKL